VTGVFSETRAQRGGEAEHVIVERRRREALERRLEEATGEIDHPEESRFAAIPVPIGRITGPWRLRPLRGAASGSARRHRLL
jgi:hypothetical protein